ncbi:hypothetical protein VNO77_33025 [Canavalia gladiata]|uniref:Uncharacterized protein n=1 Tax=Canavalia gladiata TaxID=3824 RepID=A0AAN9KAZ1_CANGL
MKIQYIRHYDATSDTHPRIFPLKQYAILSSDVSMSRSFPPPALSIFLSTVNCGVLLVISLFIFPSDTCRVAIPDMACELSWLSKRLRISYVEHCGVSLNTRLQRI